MEALLFVVTERCAEDETDLNKNGTQSHQLKIKKQEVNLVNRVRSE